MSKESYARGFCKAAAAAGMDPVKLAKYAAETWVGNEHDARKDGLEGNTDAYRVPMDSKGTTDWLKSTKPLTLPDGVVLPGGAASVTNSPAAIISRVSGGVTNSVPIWRKGRQTLGDALYGIHPNVPSGDEVKRVLEYIATGKVPKKN